MKPSSSTPTGKLTEEMEQTLGNEAPVADVNADHPTGQKPLSLLLDEIEQRADTAQETKGKEACDCIEDLLASVADVPALVKAVRFVRQEALGHVRGHKVGRVAVELDETLAQILAKEVA